MRFVLKILIGFILFNGMLLFFAPFFPAPSTTLSEGAVNVTSDSDYTTYSDIGSQKSIATIILNTIAIGGGVFAGVIVLAVLTRQYALFIGIGAFIALISGLWGASSVMMPILLVADNWIILAMYDLLIIIIGILAAIYIIGLFTGQQEE